MGGVPAFDLVADGQEFVYVQVADHLAARIAAGDLAPLSRLPREFALAREYGVSEGSVRRALNALRQKDLVITVFPKGTFVKARTRFGPLMGLVERGCAEMSGHPFRCEVCWARGVERGRYPEAYARAIERESGRRMRAYTCPFDVSVWHFAPANDWNLAGFDLAGVTTQEGGAGAG